ncbi:hypothetical protein HYH02_008427 [Chlamydomonas schloesseri]|uniref:Actin-related protein n=1 Tax=Chlamydomonas schloesseri TaxID=2026947 RepID=A0A836B3A8_9CHLO|nr:hypothetical protein HYH02_008427 [Chlamydomonas schloesseri]|eukprot:KAG2446435.1 hypothetical protein HYH02_008427 [Chlamydomonas schloesseri]
MGENVAVLDYGSRWIKAGWAYNFPTEDEPRIMTPTAVMIDPEQPDSGAAPELVRPVKGGKIINWEAFESLAYYALYELLGWELGNEGNIMICEPLLTSRPDRETMTQLMFETFNVNSLFCQDQAVLSLYATGRTSGLVVDIGHDKIDFGAVVEGVTNPTSVRRLEYGGEAVTAYLQRMLANPHRAQQPLQPGLDVSVLSPLTLGEEAAEALKELCARCGETESAFNAACGAPDLETFTLPDGQSIAVSGAEGLRLGEAFFQPGELLGIPAPSLAEAACDSASCILDSLLRKSTYEALLVVGGGSVIPGLPARLLAEVRSLTPLSVTPGLVATPEYMPQPQVPRDAGWVGGAVLAKVAQLQNHFVVKADYDEAGPGAVHRRCS